MVSSQRILNAYYQSLIFSFLALGSTATAVAQKISAKPLLAGLETRATTKVAFLKPNVIFPDILKGNEAEAMLYVQEYSKKQKRHLVAMYEKGKTLLPRATEILKKFDLPEELKVMLALESGYNANAVSRAGAVGYWQIMDIVAKEYGMKYVARGSKSRQQSAKQRKLSGKKSLKNAVKDDRRNFTAATNVAARYLTDRRKNLNDNWLLVVASYNCGEGNVRRSIRKSGVENASFWDIKQFLPAETRAYVQNFIAMNVIYNNYDLFLEDKLRFVPQKLIVQPTLRDAIMANGPEYRAL